MSEFGDIETQSLNSDSIRRIAEQRERRLQDRNENVSKCISLYCYIVVVILLVAFVLMVIVVSVPHLVDIKNKEVLISIVSILFIAAFVILFVSRNHPIPLLMVISFGLALGSYCLGLVTFGLSRII